MAADNVKSASITTLDAVSPSLNPSLIEGSGAAGREVNHSDFVAMTAAGLASTSSLYKVIRLPSSCILKQARLFTKAQLDSNGSPTLAVDLGAYYSDSTIDGTASANQGVQISANCFMAAKVFGGAAGTTEIDAISNLDASLRNSPLWAQVGLSADPGGYIDVVLAVHTVAATAVAGNVGVNISTVN